MTLSSVAFLQLTLIVIQAVPMRLHWFLFSPGATSA